MSEGMAEGSKKFVQFGCWNQGLCGDKNPLTSVTNSLRQYTLTQNPEFIVVAGDNYYPDKVKNKATGKKIKTIIPDNLNSGFLCLPDNIEIDIILGNHDLEPDVPIQGVVGKDVCYIIKNEKSLAAEKNINLVLYKSRNLGDTLLLLIDTTMYDTGKLTEFLPCYEEILGIEDLNIDQLHAIQWEFISREVSNFHGKNIIIVGHHPITGYKKKEIKEKNAESVSESITSMMPESIPEVKKKKEKKEGVFLIEAFVAFTTVLSEIYKLKPDAEYYYLCADLHLYQKGIVRIPVGEEIMTINQYIVGTGGTELDPNPIDENFTVERANQNQIFRTHAGDGIYELEDSIQNFGFLVCHYSDNLSFEFIPVEESGGKGKRRSKRKSKRRSKRNSKRKRRCR